MAELYDRMCALMVPRYDFLQEEVLAAVGEEPTLVVDLGAGSGIFLEKTLTRFPRARGLWVDYSPDFETVARRRLARFGGRITFHLSALEEEWEAHLPGAPDLVLSMSAIHHLTRDEKRQLYRRCYDALAPGGQFFNIDEMETLCPEATLASLRRWVEYVDSQCRALSVEQAQDCRQWQQRFSRWAVRNVDGFGGPKEKGDDLHESFLDQVRWLEEIGFREPDLYIKYYLWCVIGGKKP
jgi:SAM-dependent methyltransferase